MQTLGFLLFLIGAAGMDSANQIIPAIMLIVGLTILIAASRKQKCLAQQPTKANAQDKYKKVA